MQTGFSPDQLKDPDVREAERILRVCVHCGFCTATCPTYVLLGDELDGPRGRIYLIKNMLEGDKPATEKVVKHIDRCLSCLSCMTTCPSGVNYMRLVDHARIHIEETFARPRADRWLRGLLAWLLPKPALFRLALLGAAFAKPLRVLLRGRLRALLDMAPGSVPPPSSLDRPGVFPAQGERRRRVALLAGCAQRVLDPDINDATIRLLTRLGCEVVVAPDAGCCGALTHHMGREADAQASVRNNVAAWSAEIAGAGLDAIVINASGCGTMVKDYAHVLRDDPTWADRAAQVAALARDVSEVIGELDLAPTGEVASLTVAYHSACSLQHGQKIHEAPRDLLRAAGFDVRDVAEGHLCCGSAGTYNLLQPDLAARLLERKAANIRRIGADVVAAGNIGCMTQIGGALDIPVVHTVELLDWATGGPKPAKMG